MKNNRIFTISGPTGSGKTTLSKAFGSQVLVSVTTREKRPGEIEGVDYYFISKEEFEKLLENDLLVEMTYYNNHYYGLTKTEVESKLELGDCAVVVDRHGSEVIKTKYPEQTIRIILIADKDKTITAIKNRKGSEKERQERIALVEKEIQEFHDYLYKDTFIDLCGYKVDQELPIEKAQEKFKTFTQIQKGYSSFIKK